MTGKEENDVRGNMRTLAIWAIAIGSIFLLVAIQGGQNRRGTEISFSEMLHNISKLDEMDDGLAELRVKGMDWRLSLNNGNVVYTTTGVLTDDFVNGLVKDHPGLVVHVCLLYTSPSPRDVEESRMPSSA